MQGRLALPLAGDLVATHSLTLIALAFTAQHGTAPLAVVALGTTLYAMAGRLLLAGLCNALDTAAAQVCACSQQKSFDPCPPTTAGPSFARCWMACNMQHTTAKAALLLHL